MADARRGIRRLEVRGRQCQWCKNTDADCAFATETVCEVDARQLLRPRGKCPRCGGPRGQRPEYCPCSPPSYLKLIIVLEEGTGRERTVCRSPDRWGWAHLKDLFFKTPADGSAQVVTLPRGKWARTRR